MHLGSRIRKILEEKKITITALASEVGVKREHMQRVLSKEEIPLKLLKKVCDLLGYSVSEMLDENKVLSEPEAEYARTIKDQLQLKDEIIKGKNELIKSLQDQVAILKKQKNKRSS